MLWIKLGIMLTGFLYAGLLPYTLRKALHHIEIDLKHVTLSFLSNRELYGDRYLRAYKRLLFATAILNYSFFWMLSLYYDLGEYENFMRYLDYCFAVMTLLAFVPHNIQPLSFERLGKTFQRLLHNLLAILVFVMIPLLIFTFQVAIFPDNLVLAVGGMAIIGITITLTVWFIIIHYLNGIAELVFITGVSIWSIFVTLITFIN